VAIDEHDAGLMVLENVTATAVLDDQATEVLDEVTAMVVLDDVTATLVLDEGQTAATAATREGSGEAGGGAAGGEAKGAAEEPKVREENRLVCGKHAMAYNKSGGEARPG
jgi:hypothetical protein